MATFLHEVSIHALLAAVSYTHLDVYKRQVEKAEIFLQRYEVSGVFFARLLPVIRHLISTPAGIVRMGFGIFSLVTVLGSFAWCPVCLLYTSPGHFLLPPLRGIPGPCEPEQRSAAGRGQQDGPLPCLLYTSHPAGNGFCRLLLHDGPRLQTGGHAHARGIQGSQMCIRDSLWISVLETSARALRTVCS